MSQDPQLSKLLYKLEKAEKATDFTSLESLHIPLSARIKFHLRKIGFPKVKLPYPAPRRTITVKKNTILGVVGKKRIAPVIACSTLFLMMGAIPASYLNHKDVPAHQLSTQRSKKKVAPKKAQNNDSVGNNSPSQDPPPNPTITPATSGDQSTSPVGGPVVTSATEQLPPTPTSTS